MALRPNKQRILELNDRFRSELRGGRVMVTQGIAIRGEQFVQAAIAAVQAFSAFSPDNDPHGEHDFGVVDVDGTRVFFKIDYYDRDGEAGSENPADPTVTLRVLTILLAQEY